jgi:DNA-directed RNA polymerase specialized sigma subunit
LFVLDTHDAVVRALITYTDWWQPSTSSVMQVGKRHVFSHDGIHPGLLDTLDLRTELCRRMQLLEDRDRRLLYLWYVRQDTVEDISRALRVSRRQCFRRRSAAIRTIVDGAEDPGQRAS